MNMHKTAQSELVAALYRGERGWQSGGDASGGSFAGEIERKRGRKRENRLSIGVVTRDVTAPLFYFAVASRGCSRRG